MPSWGRLGSTVSSQEAQTVVQSGLSVAGGPQDQRNGAARDGRMVCMPHVQIDQCSVHTFSTFLPCDRSSPPCLNITLWYEYLQGHKQRHPHHGHVQLTRAGCRTMVVRRPIQKRRRGKARTTHPEAETLRCAAKRESAKQDRAKRAGPYDIFSSWDFEM